MKVLVTGAYGFIGSHVVRELLAQGYAVRALHLPNENLTNLNGVDVEPFVGDIRDREKMLIAVAGCERVFHLAGLYAMWAPQQRKFWDINVDGTYNVFQACAAKDVEKVIYTSTVAVFGGQGLQSDATENTPFCLAETGDPYSTTKYAAHRVAESFAAMGLDLTIVCPCGPIGPGDIAPTPTGQLLLMSVNSPVAAVVDSVVNLADVRDIAMGHLLAADKGKKGESYLLGNRNISVRELAAIAQQQASGERGLIISLPRSFLQLISYGAVAYANHVSHKAPLLTPASIRSSALGGRADCSKALLELGLPTRPIEESVRDALSWWAQRDGYITNKKVLGTLRQQ